MDSGTTKTIRIPVSGGIPVEQLTTSWASPSIVCVRKFFGLVYMRIERDFLINGKSFGSESIRGFFECSEDGFLKMSSMVGKECDVDFKEASGVKRKWSIEIV